MICLWLTVGRLDWEGLRVRFRHILLALLLLISGVVLALLVSVERVSVQIYYK
jgi:hypothetical protein